MPMANREGVFHAWPVSLGVAETGPNNLVTVTIECLLFEERQADGSFANIEEEGMHITAYQYLEKRDGTVNDFAVNALKEAFGWDGRDPFELQDADWSDHAIQITLGWETYEGTERLKVQFINPYGSSGGGGVTQADDEMRRRIMNRFGPKLRAVSGGTKHPPKKKSKPKPKPQQKAPPSKDEPAATRDDAWEAFAATAGDDETDEQLAERWRKHIRAVTGKDDTPDVTPAEWAKVRAACAGDMPDEDDIPF